MSNLFRTANNTHHMKAKHATKAPLYASKDQLFASKERV